ncbi:MAG: glycosyltransferase family 2 protein, partial [Candidatus Binatia bacterium]
LWLPRKLERQAEFLSKDPECRFCQTEEIWIRRGVRVNPKKRHQKPSGWVFAQCLEICRISPSAVVIRKEFFAELGGFDEGFPVCEDYELWLRASLRSPFFTLSEPGVVKRGGHPDQLSKKYPAIDRFRVQALEKILELEALTPEMRRLAQAERIKKLRYLAQGFQKRYPLARNRYQDKLGP